jgi:hypothetical protein
MPISTLFLGSTGKDVELLQQALFGKKFYAGLIDGAFDTATEQAVIAFQRSADLKPDGVAGPITLGALGLLGDDAAADPVTSLSVQLVSAMCAGAPLQNIRTHLPNINRALIAHGLQAPPMVLMAIATIHVESGQFKPVPEGISQFNTVLPGGPPFAKYDHRQDLGNLGPDDGQKFRGRGSVFENEWQPHQDSIGQRVAGANRQAGGVAPDRQWRLARIRRIFQVMGQRRRVDGPVVGKQPESGCAANCLAPAGRGHAISMGQVH